MKKLVFLSSLVLATAVVAAPAVAFAQTPAQPSCAEAITTMNKAQAAFDAAAAADEAAADAQKGADALAAAKAELSKAQEAALSAGVPVESQTAADADRIRAELADLEKVEVDDRARNQARIDDIRKKLPLIDAVVSARAKVDAAAKAAATAGNPAVLRAEADKTDAAKLAEALATAKAVADDACRGLQGEPGFVDLDCRDFPLPDGRTAQQVLDATPGQDPHRLDLDDDRVACDETIDDGNDSGTGGDFDQVGELPTAIDTGRA